MKKKLLLWLSLVTKAASIGTGVASLPIVAMLPAQYAGYAAIAFAGASLIKDTTNRIADLADDGIANNSYHG
jgi:hypothetical protein